MTKADKGIAMASKRIAAWCARTATVFFLILSFAPLDAVAQAASERKVDPALAARLKNVMVPLLAKMDRPIPLDEVKVSLADDDSINAGNAGGGNFLVTAGLLERANDDQLRAIMAHEIAHADKNHVAHQQLLNTGLQIGISLLDQWFPGSSALTPIAGQAFSARYGRGEELQADAHGVEILRRAGYDGKKMMGDTLSWLQQQDGGGGGNRGLAGFFATHPATGDRVEAIRNLD